MSTPDAISVPLQRRRLTAMLAINLVCIVVAAASALQMIAHHAAWAGWPFAGAIIAGFGSHLWLVLGLPKAKGGV